MVWAWLAAVLGVALVADQIWTRRERLAPRLYRPSARLGWTLAPGVSRHVSLDEDGREIWGHVIRINGDGFNDREWPPVPAAARRVLVIGDSIIESRQVPREKNFVAIAEQLLRDEAPGTYEILNVGVAGWGVDSALNYLQQRMPQLSPHTVILGIFVGNDLLEGDYASFRYLFRYAWDCRRYDKPAFSLRDGRLVRRNFPAWRNVIARFWSEGLYPRSRTFRRVYQAVNRQLEARWNGSGQLRRRGVTYNDFIERTKGAAFFYEQTCAQVEALAAACAARGTRFGVMLEPNFPLFYPPRPDLPEASRREYDRDVAHYREMEGRLSAKYPLLGLLEPLHAAGTAISYAPADPHFNPDGHRLVGRRLADFVRRVAA